MAVPQRADALSRWNRINANGRPQGRPFRFRVALSSRRYFFSSSPGLGGGLLGGGPGGGCPGPRAPCGGGGGGCGPGCGGGCTRCCCGRRPRRRRPCGESAERYLAVAAEVRPARHRRKVLTSFIPLRWLSCRRLRWLHLPLRWRRSRRWRRRRCLRRGRPHTLRRRTAGWSARRNAAFFPLNGGVDDGGVADGRRRREELYPAPRGGVVPSRPGSFLPRGCGAGNRCTGLNHGCRALDGNRGRRDGGGAMAGRPDPDDQAGRRAAAGLSSRPDLPAPIRLALRRARGAR